MIYYFLIWVFGFTIGIIAMVVFCNPFKAYDEGYEAARESFTDHDTWFNEGWKAAEKFYKNRLFETALEMHSHQELMESEEAPNDQT